MEGNDETKKLVWLRRVIRRLWKNISSSGNISRITLSRFSPGSHPGLIMRRRGRGGAGVALLSLSFVYFSLSRFIFFLSFLFFPPLLPFSFSFFSSSPSSSSSSSSSSSFFQFKMHYRKKHKIIRNEWLSEKFPRIRRSSAGRSPSRLVREIRAMLIDKFTQKLLHVAVHWNMKQSE